MPRAALQDGASEAHSVVVRRVILPSVRHADVVGGAPPAPSSHDSTRGARARAAQRGGGGSDSDGAGSAAGGGDFAPRGVASGAAAAARPRRSGAHAASPAPARGGSVDADGDGSGGSDDSAGSAIGARPSVARSTGLGRPGSSAAGVGGTAHSNRFAEATGVHGRSVDVTIGAFSGHLGLYATAARTNVGRCVPCWCAVALSHGRSCLQDNAYLLLVWGYDRCDLLTACVRGPTIRERLDEVTCMAFLEP